VIEDVAAVRNLRSITLVERRKSVRVGERKM